MKTPTQVIADFLAEEWDGSINTIAAAIIDVLAGEGFTITPNPTAGLDRDLERAWKYPTDDTFDENEEQLIEEAFTKLRKLGAGQAGTAYRSTSGALLAVVTVLDIDHLEVGIVIRDQDPFRCVIAWRPRHQTSDDFLRRRTVNTTDLDNVAEDPSILSGLTDLIDPKTGDLRTSKSSSAAGPAIPTEVELG